MQSSIIPVRLVATCLAIAVAVTGGILGAPARADTIYDSHVETRLDLAQGQRAQVRQISEQSNREMLSVFQKYGINPKATPVFDKLVRASSELQAIERRERKEMAKILTPEQLKQYDAIINETRIRVRKAAQ